MSFKEMVKKNIFNTLKPFINIQKFHQYDFLFK